MASNLLNYAKKELDVLDDGSEMQKEVNKDILDIVRVFSSQGHSGFSGSYALRMLNKLLQFYPLTPLKGTDEEWGTEADDKQNKRYYSCFKDENGAAFDTARFSYCDPGDHCSYFNSGLSYKVKFPYMPRESYVIKLPKKDMTNDEKYAYIKAHENDNEDMKDISEHLVKRY